MCAELDARAEEFGKRQLTGKYPYLWLDALYEGVRIDDQIVSNAVVIAYGVTASRYRDVVAIDVEVRRIALESDATFVAGINDTLAFLAFPIEHLNKEIRRRTRSIGIFPSPESALQLITMTVVEPSEDWMTERRYMSPESLELVLQS
uniref:Mutator family transposase n=1 Tax=mine drainage metagenome TaxID=410659 RepID=E6PD41_9ZZZZ